MNLQFDRGQERGKFVLGQPGVEKNLFWNDQSFQSVKPFVQTIKVPLLPPVTSRLGVVVEHLAGSSLGLSFRYRSEDRHLEKKPLNAPVPQLANLWDQSGGATWKGSRCVSW